MHRYLLASLRDVDGADDLARSCAAIPARGLQKRGPGPGAVSRLRRAWLYNLMMDYHRKRRSGPLCSTPVCPSQRRPLRSLAITTRVSWRAGGAS